MSNVSTFDKEVSGLINKDRQRDYGHPADHFLHSSDIKRALRAAFKGDERYLHALEMIADKMVRLCNSPEHLDSWIDIAGYARTAVMVMDHSDAVAGLPAKPTEYIATTDNRDVWSK